MPLPVFIVGCRVLETMLEPHAKSRSIPVTFLEYGYHRTPKKLVPVLQEKIDAISEPSLIVLGYGLCGNGVAGLKARQHTLLIPRTDDCIAILLGSRDRYVEEFENHPGTYYLTRGWLESGSNPLAEYVKLVEKYGDETANWLIDQQYRHYRRLVYIALDPEDLRTHEDQVRQIADFCAARWNMQFESRIGTSELVDRLMSAALEQRDISDELLVIHPGEEIAQTMFLPLR